jgi:hypothetical protein
MKTKMPILAPVSNIPNRADNMVEIVSVFQTSDGKIFKTEEEATIHENKGQFSERVERFIRAHEWNRGRDTAARNIVLRFMSFEAVHGSEGPAPVVDLGEDEKGAEAA